MDVCMQICMYVDMCLCRDGWMDGRKEGWMDGWMDVSMHSCMQVCMHVCMYACMYVRRVLCLCSAMILHTQPLLASILHLEQGLASCMYHTFSLRESAKSQDNHQDPIQRGALLSKAGLAGFVAIPNAHARLHFPSFNRWANWSPHIKSHRMEIPENLISDHGSSNRSYSLALDLIDYRATPQRFRFRVGDQSGLTPITILITC